MISIVQRQPADKTGPEIVSSVLTTEAAQRERGRQEINYSTPDRILETGTILDLDFVPPGSTVEIQSRGEARRGKAVSFSIQISGSDVSASIVVEVPK